MKNRKKTILFLLENIFYYGLIVIFSRNILNIGNEFLSLNPHPFFILTGIMAYRYGVHLGVISATIATLIYGFMYVSFGHDIVVFFYDFQFYKFILIFYIFSFTLGRIKDNQLEKEKDFNEKISLLHKNYKTIYENNNKLLYLNNRLKEEIIKSEESLIALHGISTSLNTLEIEELTTNLIGIFKTYINAEAISFYSIDNSKEYLRLAVAAGKNRKLPNSIKISEYPEFEKIIREKKYGKRDGKNMDIPVFYAPILKDEEVIGILNIERLSYERYTTYTEKIFDILISWTSQAITNATSYSDKVKNENYYEGTTFMKFNAFKRRVSEEDKRVEMFGLSYILLKFKLLVNDAKKVHLPIRDIDRASYNPEKKLIYILFPVTKAENRNLLKSKLLDRNKGILEEYYED